MDGAPSAGTPLSRHQAGTPLNVAWGFTRCQIKSVKQASPSGLDRPTGLTLPPLRDGGPVLAPHRFFFLPWPPVHPVLTKGPTSICSAIWLHIGVTWDPSKIY